MVLFHARKLERAPEVEQLYVVQRTPPWVLPHSSRPITQIEQRLYRRLPALQRMVRGGVYAGRELLVLGFVKHPRLMLGPEQVARRQMRSQVSDPALLERVTPHYTIGCKRILPSNRWYPTLGKPNVELLTGGLREVRPTSIVAGDGAEREVDTIIFGTGFKAAEMPVGMLVRGRGGLLLDALWHGSPRAHLGTAIAGFPNFFLMLGPNTGLGHNSMVYMIESQIAHVMAALRAMRERGADTVEVRTAAQHEFNADVDERMQGTVWETGCSSWYQDETGRNSTLWPDWTWRFRQRAASVRDADYTISRASAAPP